MVAMMVMVLLLLLLLLLCHSSYRQMIIAATKVVGYTRRFSGLRNQSHALIGGPCQRSWIAVAQEELRLGASDRGNEPDSGSKERHMACTSGYAITAAAQSQGAGLREPRPKDRGRATRASKVEERSRSALSQSSGRCDRGRTAYIYNTSADTISWFTASHSSVGQVKTCD